MPKKTLKQLAPSPARLRRWGALDRFGEGIYSGNLWHINRYSASMAFFVGPFVAFLPVRADKRRGLILVIVVASEYGRAPQRWPLHVR